MTQTFSCGWIYLLLLFALAACSDPISDVKFEDWEPEVAAPVLNTSFTLRDAIGGTDFSEYLSEDEDSAIRLYVSQPLFDVTPASSIDLPNITIPLVENSTVFNLQEEGIDFSFSRVDLDPSNLIFTFRNDYPQDADVVVTTANFRTGGESLTHRYTVPANSTTSDTLAMPAYSFLVDPQGNIDVAYTATLTDGSEVQLTLGAIAMETNEFSYAEGRLDNINIDLGSDTVLLNMLDVFEPGTIELVDPVARLTVNNQIGVPFQLRTPSSNALLGEEQQVDLVTPLNSGFTFAYPSLEEGMTTRVSMVQIDRESSNMLEILNQFPQELRMELQGQANPDSLNETFFIHRDARISANFELDMPLSVRFNGFELEQEFVFNGSSLAEAKTASFLLTVNNGFGLSAATQVYFYDGGDHLIDSLFSEPSVVLAAAEVNQVGATTAPTKRVTEVEFDEARVQALAGTRRAVVVINLNSPSEGADFTRLYYDNRIDVQLGARVSANPF